MALVINQVIIFFDEHDTEITVKRLRSNFEEAGYKVNSDCMDNHGKVLALTMQTQPQVVKPIKQFGGGSPLTNFLDEDKKDLYKLNLDGVKK